MSNDVMHRRAMLGVASRWGTEADKAEAARDLAAAKIHAYIERVVAEAPPLTDEQREQIAALLMGGAK